MANAMSGGQQQRVGIARALVVDPKIIFADEPTGNLDSKTTMEVLRLMQRIVREQQQTLVMVTHDNYIAGFADRQFHIVDGKILKIEEKKKETQESLVMAGTVAFSIVAAVAIFMVLPYFLSSLMKPIVPSYHLRTVIEGFVRIGIFIIYILLISRMEDIQRTFMYHGAEHKCINCIEHGLPLTVENVRNSSRQHKRCGTSFLFFVLAISIILLLLIRVESPLMRVVVRIVLLPVIAGVSYEVLKLAGNSDNPVVNLLSKPGMAIQKMTTSEPDDGMIEVAIQAVEAVFDWRAYERDNFHTS